MGLGPYVYLAWFGFVLSSVVIAAVHLIRSPTRGIGCALAAVAGSLLSWALVSAYIGVCELDSYATSKAFAVSLFIGAAGIGLFVFSGIRLKQTVRKSAAGDSTTPCSRGFSANLLLAMLGIVAVLLFLWFSVDTFNIMSTHP